MKERMKEEKNVSVKEEGETQMTKQKQKEEQQWNTKWQRNDTQKMKIKEWNKEMKKMGQSGRTNNRKRRIIRENTNIKGKYERKHELQWKSNEK